MVSKNTNRERFGNISMKMKKNLVTNSIKQENYLICERQTLITVSFEIFISHLIQQRNSFLLQLGLLSFILCVPEM